MEIDLRAVARLVRGVAAVAARNDGPQSPIRSLPGRCQMRDVGCGFRSAAQPRKGGGRLNDLDQATAHHEKGETIVAL